MKIKLLKSKIHRATVTEANLDYIGSISIDEGLMQASNLLEYEQVHVLNITNGNRFITYAISAHKNSGEICINGAAAHLATKGDLIIVVAYGVCDIDKAKTYAPKVIHVNKKNQIVG